MCKRTACEEVSEVVKDAVFISGVQPARDRGVLIGKLGITHVVNVTQNEKNHFEDDIKYLQIPVLDVREADLGAHFQEASDFIEQAVNGGGRVLVHCMAGISRSPSIVAAYLVLSRGHTLADALDTVTRARQIASPNPSFVKQLIDTELNVRGTATVDVECYRAARKLKIDRAKQTLWELVADLQAHKDPGAQVVVLGGRCMYVTRVLDDPRVARVDGFVSDEEADHLVKIANERGLKLSHVVGSKESGAPPKGRRSTSCRVDRTDPVVRDMVERAACLVNMSPYHTEAIQVIHYGVGERYDFHHDWFQPDNPGYAERVKDRGQRLVSFFVYLSGCEEGGCTYFPVIDKRFEPKKGTAVVWYNRDVNGNMDARLLHAGEPVIRGEKYGLNIWFREHSLKPEADKGSKAAANTEATSANATEPEH